MGSREWSCYKKITKNRAETAAWASCLFAGNRHPGEAIAIENFAMVMFSSANNRHSKVRITMSAAMYAEGRFIYVELASAGRNRGIFNAICGSRRPYRTTFKVG